MIDRLYCCTAVHNLTVFSLVSCAFVYKDVLSDTRNKFASPNSRIALFSQRLLFREDCSRELAQLVIRSGRLNWGGYYRSKPHDRLSRTIFRSELLYLDYQNKVIASEYSSSFVFLNCRICIAACHVENGLPSFYQRPQK